jgi:hypothetical protein
MAAMIRLRISGRFLGTGGRKTNPQYILIRKKIAWREVRRSWWPGKQRLVWAEKDYQFYVCRIIKGGYIEHLR